jgi:hypothetical protein
MFARQSFDRLTGLIDSKALRRYNMSVGATTDFAGLLPWCFTTM